MRDADVRSALHALLRVWHAREPDTRVVDEFDLCNGAARIDVAVLNGKLTGWEIKSPRDRLDRLPSQVTYYSRVCDEAWLVTDHAHLAPARKIVPDWWGLMLVAEDEAHPMLTVERDAQPNPGVDPASLVRLLWRGEALIALESLGHGAEGLGRAPRRVLWSTLADELPVEKLRDVVREQVKQRRGWREAARPRVPRPRTNGRRLLDVTAPQGVGRP